MNPDASDETFGLAYNVRLAKRAIDAGMKIYLDLHLSETRADPSKQVSHSSFHDFWTKAKLKDSSIHWCTTDINSLAWSVYIYTQTVCNAFAEHNLPIGLYPLATKTVTGFYGRWESRVQTVGTRISPGCFTRERAV